MRREVGHVEALNRWTRYLDQTPPRYCSPERFAEMHSAWAPKAGAPDRRYPTAEEIDARMRCEAEDYEPAA